MIRPMLVRSSVPLFVLTVLLVGAVALGCGNLAPSFLSAGRGIAHPAACSIKTPPGPDDRVPGPGEMDVSDLGNGRWRLCLDEPVAFVVEGSAWCTWDEGRTFVREVAGLPIAVGEGATIDGGVAIDGRHSCRAALHR